MTNLDDTRVQVRLDRALEQLSAAFRGMTARADEAQCKCHWGSEEELAQLKVPDTELDADLLYRTWSAGDWTDHGAMLRRILPQLAASLADGLVELRCYELHDVGRVFIRAGWQQWPAHQSAAVREFLQAWWAHILTSSEPAYPAHDVLAFCAEASAELGPWLAVWEELDHTAADRHLAELAYHWEADLLMDQLPWNPWDDDEEALCAELQTWLARHAPTRLHSRNATPDALHCVRLLGLTGPARWDDPYWPARYT
ncbi:hypothetical protein [Streptomyces sp. NPDC051211]|uniref:hypothetical protein n=1 Tax=Streptomyces sp. NPDC051211 TaxID=3154643 RepID=UPI00344D499F